MAKEIYGIDTAKEQMRQKRLRDTRSGFEKFKDKVDTSYAAFIPIAAIPVAFLFPSAMELMLLTVTPYVLKRVNKHVALPFFKPQVSNEIDPKHRHPGTGKPQKAEGISFFGNDINTGDELWFMGDNVKTHCLIMGTTGSGKTELLVSLCQNALNQASGFIYVDGKGDSSLFLKIFSLVRRMGREDDLLVINYMPKEETDEKSDKDDLTSNTMNPFASGSSEELTELIVSLLPDGGGDGMWKGRAAIFMSALMRVLVAMRNDNKILLDVNAIRKYFNLDILMELIQRKDIKEKSLEGLKEYIENLPGFVKPTKKDPNPKQDFGVYEQHGFITMQYTEVFGLLADSYGYIMKTQLGEVDFFDVVVNRRILVVLLPALAKSQQSLGNLGKIIVASTRQMMSSSLGGGKLEGSKKDIIDSKPTSAASPYLTIFDEYGYYAVEGAAVMPAQARSLGFSMVFAGQDYQAFKKGSAEEAASIVANCAIKICMKLEDPTETLEIFQKGAGRGEEAKISSLSKKSGMGGARFVDADSITFDEVDRINGRDLKNQGPGEAHILFGDHLVRMKSFYAAPESSKTLALNTFLPVRPPSYDTIKLLTGGFNRIKRQYVSILKDPKLFQSNIKEVFSQTGINSEFSTVLNSVRVSRELKLLGAVSSIFGIASYIEKVEFIDDKIVLGIKENFEDHKEKMASIQSEDDSLFDDEDLKEDAKDDIQGVDRVFASESSGSSNVYESLRRGVDNKVSVLKSVDADAKKTFEMMSMRVSELQQGIASAESSINNVLKSDKVIDDDNPRLSSEYTDITAQKTVVDVGYAATPSKTKLDDRKNKNEFIDEILNDIIIDDED